MLRTVIQRAGRGRSCVGALPLCPPHGGPCPHALPPLLFRSHPPYGCSSVPCLSRRRVQHRQAGPHADHRQVQGRRQVRWDIPKQGGRAKHSCPCQQQLGLGRIGQGALEGLPTYFIPGTQSPKQDLVAASASTTAVLTPLAACMHVHSQAASGSARLRLRTLPWGTPRWQRQPSLPSRMPSERKCEGGT